MWKMYHEIFTDTFHVFSPKMSDGTISLHITTKDDLRHTAPGGKI